MNLEFLKFLEGIRTPVLDILFSAITHFGEETVFILIGLIYFWCIGKKQGYYILSIGFTGTVINQFLKLWFRIPRPWVLDKSFTIVESARAGATGYSFPSGHTQTAVGVFGGIARCNMNIAIRIVCAAIAILVPLSRMYLGVHTPLDVEMATVVALITVIALYPVTNWAVSKQSNMRVFLALMTTVSFLYLVFVLNYNFPSDADKENILHGIKNAYKILGCITGLWLAFEIDNKFIQFKTDAVWWAQILKLIIGVIPILAIKTWLKTPLNSLFGGSYIADAVRYFLITLFAGGIWPISFKFFGGLGKNCKCKKQEL